jgi:hypothetical protein
MAVKKKNQTSDLMLIIIGMLIGLGLGLVIYCLVKIGMPASAEISQAELTTYCVKEGTINAMSLEDALTLAVNSECTEEGTLSSDFMCNSVTGTWWIDLDVQGYPNCNPACVINVETEEAGINWRCTGAIP